jgi:hypothetical protein
MHSFDVCAYRLGVHDSTVDPHLTVGKDLDCNALFGAFGGGSPVGRLTIKPTL